MNRNFIKRWMPTKERLRKEKSLQIFGDVLLQPNLWGINRVSVARAAAIGLFWAMIPMPFQMIPAAFCAIRLKANVALSMALVWITNPLTMPPIFYGTYRLGRWLLQIPKGAKFEFTAEAIEENFSRIWAPLYAGSLVAAILVASLSFAIVNLLWRWNTSRRWKVRRRVGARVDELDGAENRP